MRTLFLIAILIFSSQIFGQVFYIGQSIKINSNDYQLLGISSDTRVASYKFIGKITETHFFNKKIGDIIIGVKNNVIVTTIYNLIPESTDVGVPKSLVNSINEILPYPLTKVGDIYGVSIDNVNYTLSRSKNTLTFNKDRIMYFTSIKNHLLKN